MREIKFRGKAECGIEELEEQGFEHENGWIYGTYLDGYIVNGVVESTDEYIALEEWCPVKIETVGQYTGLKDINYKEIFEGDILTVNCYPFKDDGKLNYNAEVYWDDRALQFCICLHCVNPKKAGISDGMCEGLTDRDIQFEVIGNIHDNPELLEVV